MLITCNWHILTLKMAKEKPRLWWVILNHNGRIEQKEQGTKMEPPGLKVAHVLSGSGKFAEDEAILELGNIGYLSPKKIDSGCVWEVRGQPHNREYTVVHGSRAKMLYGTMLRYTLTKMDLPNARAGGLSVVHYAGGTREDARAATIKRAGRLSKDLEILSQGIVNSVMCDDGCSYAVRLKGPPWYQKLCGA